MGEPPAPLTGVREVARFSQEEGFPPEPFIAPEYRAPEYPLTLQKAVKNPPPLDEAPDRRFGRSIVEAMESQGVAASELQDLDVIASLSSLRMLLGFVDGSMTKDFVSKGLTTRMRNEPVAVDLMRISRIPEAPNAICLGNVWSWVPANSTACVGKLNKQSYDVNFVRAATGQRILSGPPSTRNPSEPLHYRLLGYECGGLRMLARVPTTALIAAVDREALEGEGLAVDLASVNRRDTADLWGSTLPSRYAAMQLGDIAMIARGVFDRATMFDLQEVTREDFRLDRPGLVQDANRLLGRLVGLLRRVRTVVDSPGCKDRPLYLQFHDSELRIIAPIFPDDIPPMDPEEEARGVKEILEYVANPQQ